MMMNQWWCFITWQKTNKTHSFVQWHDISHHSLIQLIDFHLKKEKFHLRKKKILNNKNNQTGYQMKFFFSNHWKLATIINRQKSQFLSPKVRKMYFYIDNVAIFFWFVSHSVLSVCHHHDYHFVRKLFQFLT